MRSVILLSFLALALGGCVAEYIAPKAPPKKADLYSLFRSDFKDVEYLITTYAQYKDLVRKMNPSKYPNAVVTLILLDEGWKDELIPGPLYREARIYLEFMQTQARKYSQGEMSWEEVDRSIVTRGNEIIQRLAKASKMEALQKARPGGWVLLHAPGSFDHYRPLSEWSIAWGYDSLERCERGKTRSIDMNVSMWKAVLEALPDDHQCSLLDEIRYKVFCGNAKAQVRERVLNIPRGIRCYAADWVVPLLLK